MTGRVAYTVPSLFEGEKGPSRSVPAPVCTLNRASVEASAEIVAFAVAEKRALYRTTDLVALPTHSENSGLIVVEAPGVGMHVFAPCGAPWRELETHTCGWWTAVSAIAIAGALRDETPRADLDASESLQRVEQHRSQVAHLADGVHLRCRKSANHEGTPCASPVPPFAPG